MVIEAVKNIEPTRESYLCGFFYGGIIYKVTNLINGKVYIGQTVGDIIQRRSEHISRANGSSQYYFHRAIRKYGADNFKFQVICICPNMKSLNEQEKYYIAFYDSMNKGYNLTSGGLNHIISEETKQKIRQTNLGHIVSKETRKKISLASQNMSEETKEKIRQANLGKHHTPETRANMSGENHPSYGKRGEGTPMFGKRHTPETKEKMRQNSAMRGKHLSEETKGKLREKAKLKVGEKAPMWGKRHSEETKAKMREAVKNRQPVSDETRKKMRESRLKYLVEHKHG